MPKVSAVVLAAGSSSRYGKDKLEELIYGKPVWWVATEAFLSHPSVDEVVVVGKEAFALTSPSKPVIFVTGGDSRQSSAKKGFAATTGDIVLVHDAARPYVSTEVINHVIEAATRTGAAIPAIPIVDTLNQFVDGRWQALDRQTVSRVQTPQGFRRDWLSEAYSLEMPSATDDASMVASLGHEITHVPGDAQNGKVTRPGDINIPFETRTGLGYDIHSFSTDPARPLWLGGIEFPDDKPGLEGHSDADVLLHAIVDSLLGAASLGDIGIHYPNTDPEWKNCPSLRFLAETRILLRRSNWHIVNIDSTVLAERPRVMRRQDEIRAVIAETAGVEVDRVSVKATTNEKLGAIGRSEGIAAFATATLARPMG